MLGNVRAARRSRQLPEPRRVGLRARLVSGSIRLALIDAAKTNVTVGARRAGWDRFASLRTCDI